MKARCSFRNTTEEIISAGCMGVRGGKGLKNVNNHTFIDTKTAHKFSSNVQLKIYIHMSMCMYSETL